MREFVILDLESVIYTRKPEVGFAEGEVIGEQDVYGYLCVLDCCCDDCLECLVMCGVIKEVI